MGAHGSARDRRTGRLSLRSGRVKRRSGGSITPGMLIRLTTLAGLGDDPQTTEEERYRLTIARFGALVFVGDAALIFAAAAIGGRTPIAGVVIPATATAMTVCFLVGYRRLSLLVCQLLSVTGTAMIGAVVYLTHPSYGLLFVPAVCVIAFLFPLWLAIAQTCWMVVCFGVAVWVDDPAGFDPLEPSVLLAGTLAGILVIVLLLLADLEPRAGRETLAAIATRIQGRSHRRSGCRDTAWSASRAASARASTRRTPLPLRSS